MTYFCAIGAKNSGNSDKEKNPTPVINRVTGVTREATPQPNLANTNLPKNIILYITNIHIFTFTVAVSQ